MFFSGTITFTELKGVMKSLGQNPTDDELQRMILSVDDNGDNEIDFEEFLILMSSNKSKDDPDRELKEAFKVFDADGNGKISKSEMKELMKKLGQKLSDEEIEAMMNEVDSDKNGEIDFEEFKSMMASMTSSITISRYARISAVSSKLAPLTNHRHILTTPPTRFFTAATPIQPDVRLYQYQICPFCNITKSLLSHSKLDYESVEVNPLTKAELKPWSGEYRKVPIALIDGNQINGSEHILESILNAQFVQNSLEKRWADEIRKDDEGKMTMQQFQKSDSAQKWLRFAADDLAALLYPNICGSLRDSYDAFKYVKNVDSFSALQKMSIQSLGALAMYFAARKVKSKRNITDEKEALKDALDKYELEGLQSGKSLYSSGHASSPDLGDLAVFGVLYSVRGLNAHHNAIESRGGAVKEWYGRMSMQVLGVQTD
ncbi:hypothetical protein ACHAW5_002613 [Stephanodiscus triporus]|uniref:EF-hand domain-containing protein n=1 Tax=Stephanodiscus triporus TaxID=2934178 RepID=A0ABD3NK03_9STRA